VLECAESEAGPQSGRTAATYETTAFAPNRAQNARRMGFGANAFDEK